MAQFYVTFDWNGLHYVGFVVAPQQPEFLHFASYEELHSTMDALDHPWTMTFEMPDPIQFGLGETAVWEQQIAEVKESIPVDPILGRARRLFE